jgi:hypothetical protein
LLEVDIDVGLYTTSALIKVDTGVDAGVDIGVESYTSSAYRPEPKSGKPYFFLYAYTSAS